MRISVSVITASGRSGNGGHPFTCRSELGTPRAVGHASSGSKTPSPSASRSRTTGPYSFDTTRWPSASKVTLTIEPALLAG
jgi:hypothetical protein